MPDSEDGEIEPRPRDEIEDSNDTGPLLSFDFDESPMPHCQNLVQGNGRREGNGLIHQKLITRPWGVHVYSPNYRMTRISSTLQTLD